MKKILTIILKVIGGLFIGAYAVVSLILTVFLLNFNKYAVTEINDKTLIIMRDEALNPDFKKGDLVVVTKNRNDDISVGNKIFFYNQYDKENVINLAPVVDKERVTNYETTFILEGDTRISSENVIGKAETSKVYRNLGTILSIMESKFGFLFIIILPISIFFIYVIFTFVQEIKNPEDEDDIELEAIKNVKDKLKVENSNETKQIN